MGKVKIHSQKAATNHARVIKTSVFQHRFKKLRDIY